MRSTLIILTFTALLPVLGLLAGCGGGRLETGYEYRPLGSSDVERRGLYADPYTPEAQRAEERRRERRRPGPPY